ncbi:GntR family transcriptional regulator, partial [Megamonas funiformis]
MEDRGYILVLEYIKELIISGNLSVGDKLPTERKLSETLSLSRNTI